MDYIPPKAERDRQMLKFQGLDPKEWTYVSQDAESVTFRHRDGTPKYIRR
jgi:hypothetical protein